MRAIVYTQGWVHSRKNKIFRSVRVFFESVFVSVSVTGNGLMGFLGVDDSLIVFGEEREET